MTKLFGEKMTREELLNSITSKKAKLILKEPSTENTYALAILESTQSRVSLLTLQETDIPELDGIETNLNNVLGKANLANLKTYGNSINTALSKLPLVIDTSGFLSIEQSFTTKLNNLSGKADQLRQETTDFILEQGSRATKLETIEANVLEAEKRLNTHVGTLTNKIKAGEYSASAEEHRKSTRNLMIGAFVCFLAGAALVATTLFTSGDNPKFAALISKVLSSAVLLLPGFYLARESGKHYKERIRSQRMAHERAGLDNYFSDFEDTEQASKVKTALALQYFGKADQIYAVKDEKLLHEKLMDFLKKDPK